MAALNVIKSYKILGFRVANKGSVKPHRHAFDEIAQKQEVEAVVILELICHVLHSIPFS